MQYNLLQGLKNLRTINIIRKALKIFKSFADVGTYVTSFRVPGALIPFSFSCFSLRAGLNPQHIWSYYAISPVCVL
jgi:hypothetical protein